jgi:hypothetical protein
MRTWNNPRSGRLDVRLPRMTSKMKDATTGLEGAAHVLGGVEWSMSLFRWGLLLTALIAGGGAVVVAQRAPRATGTRWWKRPEIARSAVIAAGAATLATVALHWPYATLVMLPIQQGIIFWHRRLTGAESKEIQPPS